MAYKSSARGSRPVSLIVVHTAEGARTAESLGAYFYRPDIQASSHVGIDASKILQYVPYDRAAWTVRSGNPISDNAELCGFAAWTRDEWLNNHRNMLDLTAQWITARAQARRIPLTKLTPVQVAQNAWGIIGHADWTYGMHDGTHTDPGVTFPWDYVMSKVGGTPPPPPPPPPVSNPGRFAWSLPAGHYYGNIAGPTVSHGGYYASERDEVRNIQQWLIFHSCVSGVASDRWAGSGWADGKWENATDVAMRTWHARYYPNQPYPAQCWNDDYNRLARP